MADQQGLLLLSMAVEKPPRRRESVIPTFRPHSRTGLRRNSVPLSSAYPPPSDGNKPGDSSCPPPPPPPSPPPFSSPPSLLPFQAGAEIAVAAGVAQPLEGFRFDLADTLAGDAEMSPTSSSVFWQPSSRPKHMISTSRSRVVDPTARHLSSRVLAVADKTVMPPVYSRRLLPLPTAAPARP